MSSITHREKDEFLALLARLPDDQVRYFYLMLGSALADKDVTASGTRQVDNISARESRKA